MNGITINTNNMHIPDLKTTLLAEFIKDEHKGTFEDFLVAKVDHHITERAKSIDNVITLKEEKEELTEALIIAKKAIDYEKLNDQELQKIEIAIGKNI